MTMKSRAAGIVSALLLASTANAAVTPVVKSIAVVRVSLLVSYPILRLRATHYLGGGLEQRGHHAGLLLILEIRDLADRESSNLH